MARKYRSAHQTGYTILLVDDDSDYAEATRSLLSGEGHQVLVEHSGSAAIRRLREQHVDLMLLDYFMPPITGEQVVTELRSFDPTLQVILQTGYANERPPREMLQRLDIQGYFDKSEGPEKLLLWVDAGLKTAATLARLEHSRGGLRTILEATVAMHKVQPLDDLFQQILEGVCRLLGAQDGLFVAGPEAELEASAQLGQESVGLDASSIRARAALGRFAAEQRPLALLGDERRAALADGLSRPGILNLDGASLVPLRVENVAVGGLYVEAPIASDEHELVRVFCNQATLAVHNTVLYEMAALDPLTGVHARRFFDQLLRRELRAALRARQPISLIMLDVDDFKLINDRQGHVVGDLALSMVGKGLRHAMRENDIVARFGGDEFAVVMPHTGDDGVEPVVQRVEEALRGCQLDARPEPVLLRASLGASTLEPHTFGQGDFTDPIPQDYFERMATRLIASADAALYRAKSAGKNRYLPGERTQWEPLPSGPRRTSER